MANTPAIAVRLDDDMLERLDKLALTYGNRSKAIRAALTLLSGQHRIKEATEKMIETLDAVNKHRFDSLRKGG